MTSAPFSPHVDLQFATHTTESAKAKQELQEIEDTLRSRDFKHLKVLLRTCSISANDPVRYDLWHKICTALHKDVASGISIYDDLVTKVFGRGDTAHDATLPTFIDISSLQHYHLSPSGVHTARRVVCILEQECPDITYSPSLFACTSLLLHYMNEEDAYNVLCAMLKSRVKYLTQTKISHDATKFILKELAKKHAKNCYQFILKQNAAVEDVLSRWIWWIFRDLPFSYLVRVFDCYLLEGPKVLIRVALAIMHLYYKSISKSNPSDSDVARHISQFCEEIHNFASVEKMLKVAFGIRGLSRKSLAKLRIKQEMIVQSKINVSCLQSNMPTSPSVDSLSVKVVRSYSGPIHATEKDGGLLNLDQSGDGRMRSSSQGATGLAFVRTRSSIIQPRYWQEIFSWLPARFALMQPLLLFSTSEHGTSLTTFFNKVDGHEPTIMVIRTTNGEVFGAFCSMDWGTRKDMDLKLSFFGNGETFVFSLSSPTLKYDWVGKSLKEMTPPSAELFMAADNTRLNIGGGGGIAITIDGDLNFGRSEKCETFSNPPLVVGQDFQCGTLEVYGFEGK